MTFHDVRHRHRYLHLLYLTILLLTTSTTGDDAAVMSKLSTSLSPTPSSWSTNTDFCKWDGITCDNSNRVTAINLPSKSLTGSLPSDLNSLSQLKTLAVQRNSIGGVLPTLANLTLLEQVILDSNNFTAIPTDFFTGLTNLQSFSITDNPDMSSWTIPENLNQNTNLQSFQAGNANIMVMVLLEVAGAIGSFISCDSSGKYVTSVNFGKQKFSGTISPAFANLTSLRSLSLNDNNLVDSIPEVLTSLPNLQLLDVSNNNLSGKIPVFPERVKFVHTGNVLLGQDVSGGPPGSEPGSGDTGGNSSGSTKGVSGGLIAGIVIGVLVFVVIILFVCYKCYLKKKNQKPKTVQDPEKGKEAVKASDLQSQSSGDQTEMSVFEGGSIVISIQVLREATNNFSEENVLGRGGFGVVYKGILQNGTKIAVKRMDSGVMGTKGLKEFQAEIAVLTKVRHRHLVALLGYCMNGNERLLVYEYMPQGTLSQHLFEWREHKTNPLSWKQRVSIALDVGRGVEYLHSLAQQSFIHRDLKPSNILLGDDMRAKVADFGLVKSTPDAKHSMETRVAGTFGYLAPEYAATGRVTTKVDVYAFGVVLMELITGRKALDDTLTDEKSHLVTWFRRALISENIVKAIDQTLDTDEEDTLESICKVAELAGHCTAREPYQRPDMGHAVNVLGLLVEQWKPSQPDEDDGYGIGDHMSVPQLLQQLQADEGTSRMFDDSFDQTQSSIISKPPGLVDTFGTSGR
ncbi:putative protein kinase RLK-Pelle-LRR-IX family [Helianthus annuus]|nr:putative protein kinase RLK-Pelle-LRR-IX family [Helianthus annuus]KAJ0686678.1 putative protein kinase RLK-Pelle-LRR-IX family [Helianthus annuus]